MASVISGTAVLNVLPTAAQPIGQAQDCRHLHIDNARVPIRDMLTLLADSAHLNIVISDKVKGDVSLHLDDVTCEQALRSVMSSERLHRTRVGAVDIIEPQNDRPLSERTETRAFRLAHANAVEVAALMRHDGASLLGADAVLQADPRTNQLLISDMPSRLDHLAAWVALLDKPVHQVQIEARIVVMREHHARQLGIRWQHDTPGAVEASTGLTLLSDPAASTAARLGLGFVTRHRLLALTLEALESEGSSQTLSQPSVVTVERQPAVIRQGQQVPYQETSASGATSSHLHDAVLALSATPVIMTGRQIMLTLDIQNDSVSDLRFNDMPVIDTNRIQTQVAVNDGETIALGGILTHKQVERLSQAPWLADVPLLGALFRARENGNERAELLIFITPRIVDTPAVAD
ncbi:MULTISPECIES: secretin N-terminal domain-containing protein [unclassified Zymobacter]|uniref:secretin N-terminal domain-containing protein n=1 Tax=unclassified Zymobacter TaxID=3048685 RepID=UPI0039C3AEF1